MDIVVRTTIPRAVELKLEWLRVVRSRLIWLSWVVFGLFPGQSYLRAGDIGTAIFLIGFVPVFVFVLATISVLRRPPPREIQYTFSEDGIRAHGVDWETFVEWDGVEKVEKKIGCYLIYTVARLFYVLPIADIPVQERAEVERLLRKV